MSIRKRRARRNASTHAVRNFLIGLLSILAVLAAVLSVTGYALVASWLEDLPDYESADAYLVAEPTTVYDAAGNTLGSFYIENRVSVELDEISPYVLDGTVDTEDVRFYEHNGVDPLGILRAAVSNLTGGSEGGSTITQQLVRNTVLSDEQFEQSLRRKVREAYISIEMEKVYTKDQILNMYLNTIFYGNGAYGIEAASITYFNKHASELTLAEAALLVGLPQSPSYYDPFVNPEAATERRNTVLDRMLSAGDITQEEHDEAQAAELQLNPGATSLEGNSTSPYWTDYVRELLSQDFSADTILQGGLKVYTTLDPTYQQAAEEAVHEQLDALGNADLNAALVAIDPDTGYILAMVGGRDYSTNQFNLATTARRQPGSSFKTITLVAALSAGMSPDVMLNCSSPMNITPTWRVQNFGNTNYGTISLRRATEMSANTGYAQVAVEIGADAIVETAHTMGIDEELSAYPSITLGTAGIPPIQMAEAYATLAAGGVHRDPVAITRIEDRNGNVVYEHEDSSEQAIDPSVAAAATDVLEGVITNGTATVIQQNKGYDQPVAGKTGTTEETRDLWFCGYTPQVAVAIWTGYVQEQTIYIGGAQGSTSQTSSMIFSRFANKVLTGLPREEFPTADAPSYLPNDQWSFSAKATESPETPDSPESAETPATSTEAPPATSTEPPPVDTQPATPPVDTQPATPPVETDPPAPTDPAPAG